jgi:hypothetical protein
LALDHGVYERQFNAVNWSTTLHRLAKVYPYEMRSQASTDAVRKMLATIRSDVGLLDTFAPQHLATSAWAMAKLGIVDTDLMDLLCSRARALMAGGELKPQDMANLMWAMAKSGSVDKHMFEAVARRIGDYGVVVGFKPQEMASVVWAIATARNHLSSSSYLFNAFSAVCDEAVRRNLTGFSPQAIANIMWACGRMTYHHPKLIKAVCIAMSSEPALSGFKPQEMANVVWSVASVGGRVGTRKLLESDDGSIAALVRSVLSDMTFHFTAYDPQAVTNILWAVQQIAEHTESDEWLYMLDSKLLKQLSQRLLACNLLGFSAQQLSTLTHVICSAVAKTRSDYGPSFPLLMQLLAEHAASGQVGGQWWSVTALVDLVESEHVSSDIKGQILFRLLEEL